MGGISMNCECETCKKENKIPLLEYAFSNSHCVISRILREGLAWMNY